MTGFKWGLVALLAVIAGVIGYRWLSGDAGENGQANAPQVIAGTVTRQPFEDRGEAIGTLRANESATITSNVTEEITAVHFEDGQVVQEDDPIVTLRNTEEEAALASAKAELAEQQREIERDKELVRRKAAPESRLDERRTMLAQARSSVAQAEARLADRVIIAPFGGTLGIRQVSVGTLVEPGDEITTIDDMSRMKLDFSVPSIYLRALSIGMPIEAKAEALTDESFRGEVVAIGTRIDPATRSIPVRAELPNEDGRLKPGMLMKIELVKDRRQALLVPEEALLQRADRYYVYVLEGEPPVPVQREVKIGGRRPGVAEVTGGLEEGERIVIDGHLKIRAGQPVIILAAESRDDLKTAGGTPE